MMLLYYMITPTLDGLVAELGNGKVLSVGYNKYLNTQHYWYYLYTDHLR